MARITLNHEASKEELMEKKVEKILEEAKKLGMESNFFFETTLKRYVVQLKIMNTLEKEIADLGATVTKEYVKGRENICTNPAITEFNKTSTAANGTVSTLITILKSMKTEDGGEGKLNSLLEKLK